MKNYGKKVAKLQKKIRSLNKKRKKALLRAMKKKRLRAMKSISLKTTAGREAYQRLKSTTPAEIGQKLLLLRDIVQGKKRMPSARTAKKSA